MPTLWNKSRKVIFSRDEVDAFRATWPGCKLQSRSYWFEFDAQGDLIDTDVPEQDDGPESVALSDDAKDWLDEYLDPADLARAFILECKASSLDSDGDLILAGEESGSHHPLVVRALAIEAIQWR